MLIGFAWILLGWSLLRSPPELFADPGLFSAPKSFLGEWGLGPEQVGPWILGCGALLVVLSVVCAWIPAGSVRAGPLLLVFALFLGVGSTLYKADRLHHEEMFGQDVWWLDDDMMISLRYARNLAEGKGLVWNEGERVEGITNPLWTVLLAVPHLLVPPEEVSLWVIGTNAALFAALLVLTYRLARQLDASPLAAGLGVVALSTYTGAVHWAAAGGETVLVSLLFVGMALQVRKPGGLVRGAVLGGLAIWTRMDAAPLAFVLLVGGWWLQESGRDRKSLLQSAAVLLAFPLVLTGLRLLYYGELLPNTYYLKATGWDGKAVAGLHYLARSLSQHGILVVPFLASLAAGRRGLPVFAATVMHVLYVVSVGGDELPRQRFFVPVAPFVFALSFLGIERIGALLSRSAAGPEGPAAGVGPAAPLLPVIVLAVAGLGAATFPGLRTSETENRMMSETANVYLGLVIRENTEPDALVAHFWAGATAYFSDRPGLDFLGKCDPEIARLPGKPGMIRPGHNKYDLAASLRREPDVIVGGLPGLANQQFVEEYLKDPYRMFAELYQVPDFLRLYFPHLVGRAPDCPERLRTVSLQFHAVFVRAGSRKARPAAEWREQPD